MSKAVNGVTTVSVLAVLGSWALAAAAWSAGLEPPRVEYSADQTISSDGHVFESKVYHARDRQRMEMRAAQGAQVFITRHDKKVSWVLMPEQNSYMEMPLAQARKDAPNDLRDCSMKIRKAGSETVDGHSATRNDIEATCPDNSRYDGSMWITRDGIPVKIDATAREGSGKGTRVLVELKNLKIGRQDPALFEVPAGYAKFAIPVFGGPGGFTGAAAPPPREPPDAGAAAGSQPGPAPTVKKGAAETGRSYTATGRSYTAQPRNAAGQGVVDKAVGAGKKLKSLFGW